jgi:glycolate oxidase
VFLAPVGSIGRYHPEGALVAARVAARRGSLCFVSANASPGLDSIAAGAPNARLVFQMYGYDQREVMLGLLRQAQQCPLVAICLTVDGPVYGRRERDLRNGFRALDKPSRPNLDVVAGALDRQSRAGFTWEDLKWFRDQTKLPLILKGVLDAEDAALAVEAGVDVVYVSNHGGRQLDFSAATVEVLPEIVEAVSGRAQVLVDSGFQRGTDVLKALALGATAVGIGKLQGWALAADGEDGLDRAMELLEVEVRTSMALIGASRVPEIGRHNLRPPRQR